MPELDIVGVDCEPGELLEALEAARNQLPTSGKNYRAVLDELIGALVSQHFEDDIDRSDARQCAISVAKFLGQYSTLALRTHFGLPANDDSRIVPDNIGLVINEDAACFLDGTEFGVSAMIWIPIFWPGVPATIKLWQTCATL